ncbi:complement component C8 gamma chain [Triplophysa dalaica]|uniref:complement component C8 gamma chain n=1 Tax=Triplophysa dalaica TaxID=1582913 RepID=UPI0024DF3748|nr:complement component C8 gamma chain [Triplophysa dalaica]
MMRFWLHLLFVLIWLSLLEHGETRRASFKPRPPQKPKPTEAEKAVQKLTPSQNIDINQMSGRWYLVSVMSRCKTLLEKGFKLESTTIDLENNGNKLSVVTTTKLNFECWKISQNYTITKTPGQFILKGKRSADDMDLIVFDTDYSSYAILVFKRGKKITMKLYGRSGIVPDNAIDKFEDHAKIFGFGLDLLFQYPHYGFCESEDKVLGMT